MDGSIRCPPYAALNRSDGTFLPSGKRDAGSPTELLQPQELSTLFQKLSSQFDWIVVDSPPVLPLSDAVALRQHIDGTLLVAMAGSTPSKAVNDAIALLGRKHILGLILNGIEKLNQPYSSYYEYHQSGKTAAAETSAKRHGTLTRPGTRQPS